MAQGRERARNERRRLLRFAAMSSTPSRRLRHEPPELGDGLVVRARLIAALRERFERRLTVVHAGAGFGKTTLLSQAVGENRLERWGTDAWLQVEEADRQPAHLLAGIAGSLPGAEGSPVGSPAELAERILALAPTEVAIILDDVHRLGDRPDAWQAISDLLDQLPSNGHLALAGRTAPPIPLGRLLASGEVAVVDQTMLAFDHAEVRAFGAQRDLPSELIAELPPWPALAVLQGAVGHTASVTYIWEEVLAHHDDATIRLLALAASFEVVDDQLLAALEPTTTASAADLVGDLPLVQHDGRGAFRFHALLRTALQGRISPSDRDAALLAAARRLGQAGADRAAIEAASRSGDDDLLRSATCRFLRQGFRALAIPDVLAVRAHLTPTLRDRAVGILVDAAVQWGVDAREAVNGFAAAEEQARAEGDVEVEALASWRLTQLRYLDDPDVLEVTPQHEALAQRSVPLGRSIVAFIRSVEAQRDGDVGAAIAALDDLDGSDRAQRQEVMIVRHFDLGRPEVAAASLEAQEPGSEPNLFAAQSLWLCGTVPVELVWELAKTLAIDGGRAGVAHEQASLLSIVAMVASQQGEDSVAADALDRAQRVVPSVGRGVQGLSLAARAVQALTAGDEASGCALLRELLALIPLGAFPKRPHLYVLGPLRALLPEATVLDDLDLGPTFGLAVTAGAAIAAGRAGDGGRAAARLPWHQVDALRANLPPPLVAELALLAIVGGAPVARPVLDQLPHPGRWLAALRTHPEARVAEMAGQLADALPERPTYDLAIDLLGGFGVRRSDGAPIDASRVGRARVRQLIGRLALRPTLSRAEVAAELWPDLAPDKAITNLRTNLLHVQQLLQPERPASGSTWFVRATPESIALSDEGVSVDLHRFEQHLRTANELERSGLPSSALLELRAACDLYRGDLLPGVADPEIDLERIRLRSLAIAARCRAGELVMARGEPESAMHDAVAALRLEPSSERATRLFARCHLAIGSTEEARRLVRSCIEELSAQRLRPEGETVALARHLGVGG